MRTAIGLGRGVVKGMVAAALTAEDELAQESLVGHLMRYATRASDGEREALVKVLIGHPEPVPDALQEVFVAWTGTAFPACAERADAAAAPVVFAITESDGFRADGSPWSGPPGPPGRHI